ncbi:Uncharacterised protein [Chlamydia trachomatis]|nr:Uncharacterised protein [Chlamydia trachomatis]CRH54824.1 Uncharacterised protein [Chlamydia trachomatis]CRH56847.1 Uncharacterised protein [Chlamydia trachomatis]
MTTFLAENTAVNDNAANLLKQISTPIFNQILSIGSIVLGIIVGILALSCIFAAVSAQFKLKSADREAASTAKRRMKNILIAFIVGVAIFALFGTVMGIIGSTTGI